MLLYAFGMHEHLYDCLEINELHYMSEKVHIVYLSNKNTQEE
jgi:hypothetical protein